ncbi:UDP-glucose 4-epimerase GalE [Iodidimonas sp. SYSU 1G8]|uniref:UDP-glucose 4-epimerase GalE n=1 Tax=Iodidimonas sp. SYSU 1G8 TaxID=3133967 RepID=UPI0031FE5D07
MGGKILVTGGAGYIGSHTAQLLVDAGNEVVVLDNLSNGDRALIPDGAAFVEGDVGDRALLAEILSPDFDAVLHFAGYLVVPDSVADPLSYYRNNTLNSHGLIETAVNAGVKHFIFSSTAATYGDAGTEPVTEDTPPNPASPYGRSKLITEWMLRDTAAAHDLTYVALRYFNVAGADPTGRRGQVSKNATHLIKLAVEVLTGQRDHMTIFGDDYNTPDGTGVRDYIHVVDLADAHVRALDYLRRGGDSQVLNCGYGKGSSVKQVIAALERVSNQKVNALTGPRRPGDVAEVVAEASRIRGLLGWQPRYDDLELIVKTALDWERKRIGQG